MRYLFRRKDSDNWYVRLQPPGQKVVERSLGTPDIKAAELAAVSSSTSTSNLCMRGA